MVISSEFLYFSSKNLHDSVLFSEACYERTYQEYVSSHAKEKCAQLKQHYEQALSRSQSELQCTLIYYYYYYYVHACDIDLFAVLALKQQLLGWFVSSLEEARA